MVAAATKPMVAVAVEEAVTTASESTAVTVKATGVKGKKCRIFEMIINPLISVTSREVSSVRSAAQNTTNQQTAVSSLSGLERFFP